MFCLQSEQRRDSQQPQHNKHSTWTSKRTKRLSCHNRAALPFTAAFTTAFLDTHSNVVLSTRDARLDVGLELLCQAVWPAKAHMESLHALRPALGNQLDKLGEAATKPARPLRLDLSHGAVAKVCLSNSALLVGGGGSGGGGGGGSTLGCGVVLGHAAEAHGRAPCGSHNRHLRLSMRA